MDAALADIGSVMDTDSPGNFGDPAVKVTSVQVLQHNTLLDTNSSFNDVTSMERAMAGLPTVVKPAEDADEADDGEEAEEGAQEGDAEEPQAAAEDEASTSALSLVSTLSVLGVAVLF